MLANEDVLTEPADDFLVHYGIKGMKWGRRKRSSEAGGDAKESKRSKAEVSDDHKVSRELKSKKVSSLSNEELRTLNARLQLETQLAELSSKSVTINAGKKHVDTLLTFADTASKAYGLINSPIVKDVKSVIDAKKNK